MTAGVVLGAVLALAGVAPDAGRVVLRYECASRLARRETTLFANGTLRWRQGRGADERMELEDLSSEELRGYLARLGAEDLSESLHEPPSGMGDWIERCDLELELAGAPRVRASFARLDSLPLPLARVVTVADELAARVDPRRGGMRLPPGYQARPGDVLRRADGVLFEVVGFTSDGRGLELSGVDQPLTLYVSKGDLEREFVALVERREQ